MEGAIETGKDGRADIALANRFKDDLLAKPLFQAVCANKEEAVRFKTFAGTAGGGGGNTSSGGDDDKEQNALKQTTFVLNCSSNEGGRTYGR